MVWSVNIWWWLHYKRYLIPSLCNCVSFSFLQTIFHRAQKKTWKLLAHFPQKIVVKWISTDCHYNEIIIGNVRKSLLPTWFFFSVQHAQRSDESAWEWIIKCIELPSNWVNIAHYIAARVSWWSSILKDLHEKCIFFLYIKEISS